MKTHEFTHTSNAIAAILPGSGSDAAFIEQSFAAPLQQAEITLIAIEPDPHNILASYLEALNSVSHFDKPFFIGGVSVGAIVSMLWAHTTTVDTPFFQGVLAAMPPWTGSPSGHIAANNALATADFIRRYGLEQAIAHMKTSSPIWLGTALERSWKALGDDLITTFEQCAHIHAPTQTQLQRMNFPVGIAAAVDDPLHPLSVAQQWHTLLPQSELQTFSLSELGDDHTILGTQTLQALQTASQ